MIQNLATHPSAFVSIEELASYWGVSRRQVRRHIETGALEAIVLGPRLYRVRRTAALDFERRLQTDFPARFGGSRSF